VVFTSRPAGLLGEPTPPTLPESGVARSPQTVIRGSKGRHSALSSNRDEAVARVLDACVRPSTAPVVAVTGPPGIGRSTVLSLVRAKLAELEIDTRVVHLPGMDVEPQHVVAVLADGLGLSPVRGESGHATLNRLLAVLAGRRERSVVFLDDVHRLGPGTRATLSPLIEALVGTHTKIVCASRVSIADRDTGLTALRARGLVTEERLRPLSTSSVDQVLTELLHARPEPGVAASIRGASGGVPAVLHAAVEGHQRSGHLRIVDRHAILVGRGAPQLPSTHPLFTDLRLLGEAAWSVLKAVAVLHPLRGHVPELAAEATGLEEEVVLDALNDLYAAGVLLRTRHRDWRFRVPVLAMLLGSCLGPYERRRIAGVAVTAIWTGRASCPDADYLPDRLVDAGRLVDPERAAAELLAHAVRSDDDELACRWRGAAARVVTDTAKRAAILHRYAVTCAVHQRFRPALEAAELVLHDLQDQLSSAALQEIQIVYVVGQAGTGSAVVLRDLAQDGWRLMPGGRENQVVTRALALCVLNRWQEAYELLAARYEYGDDGPGTLFGRVLGSAAGGVVDGAEGAGLFTTDSRDTTVSGTTADVLRVLVRTLTLAGGLGGLHQAGDVVVAPVIRAGRTGRWDLALDLARADIAAAQVHGHGPERTAVFLTAAEILTARGQLSRARRLVEHARSQCLLVPHLLALPEADLEDTLGEPQRARELLEDGLVLAEESGAIAGTGELHLALVRSEARRGNPGAARRHAARIDEISQRLGTSGARRVLLLARLLVAPDPGTAAEAVELAEASDDLYERARTLVAVAEAGFGDVRHVRTAYELFGDLDALLPRARLRSLMRARGISVPGRRETVAENERLLVGLIAEGLTNAALATVLGTSEKSVEGQLTRYFKRTGYRSRTEVAAAVLRSATSR
jgi:DNA-binding CsgD family transcriptional regulator/type II secretory pathway predicted ATPase ExeA